MFLGGCEAAGLLVAVRADCGKAGGSVLSPAIHMSTGYSSSEELVMKCSISATFHDAVSVPCTSGKVAGLRWAKSLDNYPSKLSESIE